MTIADTPPVLHLIAGINGAGKTSFYYDHLASRTPGAEFINADEIERDRWPDAIGAHSYQAAELAARRREERIAAGTSFVTETVSRIPRSSSCWTAPWQRASRSFSITSTYRLRNWRSNAFERASRRVATTSRPPR